MEALFGGYIFAKFMKGIMAFSYRMIRRFVRGGIRRGVRIFKKLTRNAYHPF